MSVFKKETTKNRVDVYRGYKLHIDFIFDYQQFLEGLDSVDAA